jgi:hypothetical protein
MAVPTKGLWKQRQLEPYVSGNWGTGINDVHATYGGPPARLTPTRPREGEVTTPSEAIPEQLYAPTLWGYEQSPASVSQITYDDRPDWTVITPDMLVRQSTVDQPPLNASGPVKSWFRSQKGGAYRLIQYFNDFRNAPSETVSEGWLNKPHGQPADSKPSDPIQYEMQTSMEQRYRARNNRNAVIRSTDEPRTDIGSRVTGQHTPVYSGGQRHYDMFPRQQMQYDRPFWYRTAGTGDPEQMQPNETYNIEPIERIPPPDPYLGSPSTLTDYGYTPEDQFYA